ncbi:hypothetical protein O181_005877 [Austropuccinia psidii MF-1]|uniref:Uncharacterized protein n=1 Tax=Austropuccinia psidii MF-1 TaxID=1389203 RepID=A0A9Q3BIY4_9BASI|nr:hypothetical protein [Austropuccinia psidii MF-1]
MSQPWRQAGHYQSLPIEDLPTLNQQGGFMEDPLNTVSNLNTAQYRKNPSTGANTCIGYTNTGLHLKYRFLQPTIMGSQHSSSRLAVFQIYQPPFTHLGGFPPTN